MKFKALITLLIMMSLTASLFAQQKKDVNSITKAEVLEMTIEELSAYDLEEVMKLMDITGASSLEELYELLLNKDVTSASKSAESVFDSPLSSTVLSYDEIIASGATCIEEALRMVPGVIVREKSNGNYDVHIRGNDNLPANNMLLYSENSSTLVMINGRPVFNYSHGATLWETLPVTFEDIDRIEVVRGPASALYGPNAVSGVINIMTKEITSDSPFISGNVQGGSLNTYIGDVAFRKKVSNKVGVGITANFETRDRTTDELYVYNGGDTPEEYAYTLNGNPVGNGYYSVEEMKLLQKDGLPLWPEVGFSEYSVYDADDTYPNPGLAKEKMAANGYLDINLSEGISINLNGGYQLSDVVTSTMGDMPTAMSEKESSTGYIDLRSKIKDFSFQANYNGGTTDYMLGNEGFELDLQQFTAQAEYDFKLNKLGIRPGVNYQSISYDDRDNITKQGRGYLNAKQTINIMAGSLRLDYKPTDFLRFVAALRTEKYNNPDDIYTSWQFVGSYKINENHLIRAVYSRANQSPFLVNTYSNYNWNIVNREYPRKMIFKGNKDHKLRTMDMFELGYRIRPSKNILIDIEGFYQKTKDFGALNAESTSLAVLNPFEVTEGTAAPIVNGVVDISFLNSDLVAKQKGVTVALDWVISEKLIAKANLTYQNTKLDNYIAISRDDIIEYQLGTAFATTTLDEATVLGAIGNYGAAIANNEVDPTVQDYAIITTIDDNPGVSQSDYKHESTPDYYGGFSITYRPHKKWEIIPQSYFYGAQKFENQYGDVNIDSKFLLNAKVSYKANDKLTLFLNGRNILNNKSVEFAYMDNTPTLVLVGFNFKL